MLGIARFWSISLAWRRALYLPDLTKGGSARLMMPNRRVVFILVLASVMLAACSLGMEQEVAPTATMLPATATDQATMPPATEASSPEPTDAVDPTALPTASSYDPRGFEELASSDRLFPAYSIDADLGPAGHRMAAAISTFSRDIEAVPNEGVMILELADLTSPRELPLGSPVAQVEWSGGRLFAGMESGDIYRVEIDQGEAFPIASLGDQHVSALAVSPDGERLAAASFATLRPVVLAAGSGEIMAELPEHQDTIRALAWSPDGTILASGAGNVLRLWQAEDQTLLQELAGHEHFIYEVGWTPDGELVASASEDGTIIVWRAASGEQLFRLYPAESNLRALAISPDGEYLAAGSNNGAIPIWNLISGQLVEVLKDDWAIHSLFWTADGRLVSASIPVSVNQGGRVLIWGRP